MGTPTVIAVPGAAKRDLDDCTYATLRIDPRGDLISQRLILDEAVLTRQADSLVIETHCVGVSPFEAGDLSRHQRVLVGKRRWVDFGPCAQLFNVCCQQVVPRLLLIGGYILIACSHRQREIIEVVEQLKMSSRGHKQGLRLVSSRQSLRVVA